jgi:Lambda phage tail tube protein, TTP
MTLAFSGSQSLIKLRTSVSPDVYTTIGEVVNFGPFGAASQQIEATHLLSTAKEYIYDLADGTTVTITCNMIPTDTAQVALKAAHDARTTKSFKYTLPAGGGSLTYSFDGLVLSWDVPTVTPSGVTQVQFNVKISGAITGPA